MIQQFTEIRSRITDGSYDYGDKAVYINLLLASRGPAILMNTFIMPEGRKHKAYREEK
jgi:hypothetical protein